MTALERVRALLDDGRRLVQELREGHDPRAEEALVELRRRLCDLESQALVASFEVRARSRRVA